MLKKTISRRSFLTFSAITAASFVLENKAIGATAKIHPKSDYPTVIIGAGLGGLCCGAFLARQGVSVTIVEQGNRPGGYACTFGRAGGRFTFDVPLHGTPVKDNTAAKGDCLRNGTYYIKRHSSDLSYALADTIKKAGGQILYNTTVERIRLKKGVVSGVVTGGGDTLPARTVVSNANVPDTFQSMLPIKSLPKDYLRDLKTYRPSLSTFVIWLGLNHDLRKEIKASGIQFLSGQGAEKDYHACVRGEVKTIPFRISFYDNIYDGYSTPGTSTLRILCLSGYEPWRKFETDYRAGHKKEYYKEKKRWTDSLLNRVEAVIQGLSSMLKVKEAATPLTNWRFTRNTEGAIYGFEQSVENAYIQ